MAYNWEEIFKGYSSRELYQICKGNTLKPNEAIPYAIKELEIRNFDFENIDEIKKEWELFDLMEEKEIADANSHRVYNYISFQKYLLILLGLLILAFVLSYYILKIPTIVLCFTVFFMFTFFVLLENFRFKSNKQRTEKIEELENFMYKKAKKSTFQQFNEDVKIYTKKVNDNRKIYMILGIILFVIIIIINVYKNFFK